MKLAPALREQRARRAALFFGVTALILALDQLTKELVRANLERGESWPSADWAVRIHYVTNTGAAFGILRDQSGFLIVTTLIGLAAILLYYRYPPVHHFIVPIAVGMMLGGAVGNLLDRIRLGRVTDFIDFPLWPAFNLADASIVVAIIALLAAYALLQPPGSEPQLVRTTDPPHELRGTDRRPRRPAFSLAYVSIAVAVIALTAYVLLRLKRSAPRPLGATNPPDEGPGPDDR